ncbi:hypothetical protein KDN24_06365 [Bacillus sp. Bva_UNVM-123]|uniref:hypothetical protein n=1 Tax=Bacillus sp. Bva_UNVM-123 TaxID=2829798 RepID=UPI00391F35A2
MFNKNVCWCGKKAEFSHVEETHTKWDIYRCEDRHENSYGIAEEYDQEDWGTIEKA